MTRPHKPTEFRLFSWLPLIALPFAPLIAIAIAMLIKALAR